MKTLHRYFGKLLLPACTTILLGTIFFASCKKDSVITTSRVKADDQVTQAQANANAHANVNAMQQDVQTQSIEINKQLATAGFKQAGIEAASLQSAKPGYSIYDIASHLPIFKSLTAAVNVTGLSEVLKDPSSTLTVFAPTDFAFAQLPAPFNNANNISHITDVAQIATLKAILLYHVLGSEVSAQEITKGRSSAETLKPQVAGNDNTIYFSKAFNLVGLNGTSVVLLPNVYANNGIVHVISSVLSFPTATIAATAIANADLSTLVAALVKTNLAGVFDAGGDYTVFAPTNEAFAKLPAPFNNADNINAITDDAQLATLANILKYHVLARRYFGFDLGFFDEHTTLADEPNNRITTVTGSPAGYVKGNNNWGFSRINPGNVLCTNGVVHVISNVLMP
jgi:transforming growth factor-beta-induced protein